MRASPHFCRLIATVGCCAVALAGCDRNPAEKATSQSQIVARIGNQVVTIHELESELRLSNVPVDKQKDPDVIKKTLSELVVRKFLLDQALAAKLDREPSVFLELLRAREQVLANAFLTRTASTKSPDKSDIDKFIASNPSRFADRKLLNIEQIAFPFGSASQSVVDGYKNATSLDQIDQQLTAAGVPHGRQTSVISTGDINSDLYGSLATRKAEDVFFLRSGTNGLFFKVTGEQASPIEGAAADNLARQLLRADAVKGEQAIAAYSANLEAKYEGEYAKIMQPSPASMPTQ